MSLQIKPTRQLTGVELLPKAKGVKLMWTELFISKRNDGSEYAWTNDMKLTCPRRPHADLINALRSLRKIMIDLNEWNLNEFKQYDVTGLKFEGMDQDDTAKVLIFGHKTVSRSGDNVPIETAMTSLSDANEYADVDKLDAGCKRVTDQCWEYVFNGKYEPDPQLELPLNGGGTMKIS